MLTPQACSLTTLRKEYKELSRRIVGFGNYEPPEAGATLHGWGAPWNMLVINKKDEISPPDIVSCITVLRKQKAANINTNKMHTKCVRIMSKMLSYVP